MAVAGKEGRWPESFELTFNHHELDMAPYSHAALVDKLATCLQVKDDSYKDLVPDVKTWNDVMERSGRAANEEEMRISTSALAKAVEIREDGELPLSTSRTSSRILKHTSSDCVQNRKLRSSSTLTDRLAIRRLSELSWSVLLLFVGQFLISIDPLL